MTFLNHLQGHLTFFDGAMGTQLIAQGMGPGEVPEQWNLTHPQQVQAIHAAYLRAGAHVINANTFGAHPLKLPNAGQMIQQGMRIARRAAQACGHPAFVALDMGPTGRLMQPFGDMSFDEAYASFRYMVQMGRDEADLILIETLSDLFEARAAVLAAKEHADLPVVVTLSLDEGGKLLTGGDLSALTTMLEGLGVDALGLNCGLGPDEMVKLMPALRASCRLPLVLCPNAGLPVSIDGRAVYQLGAEDFAARMQTLYQLGAQGLGGCCGTTPAHIAQVSRLLSGCPQNPLPHTAVGRISSYASAVVLSQGPHLVGERLNPTGKPQMKEALLRRDMDHLLLEAVRQVDAGATILDVNVGLPGLDEPEVMAEVVRALQGVVRVPLQLDSADPVALERGLRLYTGCALINSVNGKRESMAQVFPLAKKYGACVVALTLDEAGIAQTAQGRVAIARRIVEEAARYGIGKERIVVDPLCMTVSTSQDEAKTTLQALTLLKEQGFCTILGLSNVSFGLPKRALLNAAFCTMALQRGLDLAIVNPLNRQMMDAWVAARALLGMDAGCAAYVSRFAQPTEEIPAQAPAPASLTLQDAVAQGLKGPAAQLAGELLARGQPPMQVVEEMLIPALNRVGEAFEKGTLFLPQLLMSADAASAAFERVRQSLARRQDAHPHRGKVVLATVQGDIHDIGKNIVRGLLENYDFEVIDLGKDVPPERVAQAALQSGARLVGLSALMTTTVGAMAQTICLLRAQCPVRIMVGGAVLTPAYAREIGADLYARDAMSSVRYAQAVYEGAVPL